MERESGDGQEEEKAAIGQPIDQATNQKLTDNQLALKYENWQINDTYLKELLNFDIDRNTAIKALFYTDNNSVEQALNWIFNNPLLTELSKTTLEQDLGVKENINNEFKNLNLEDKLLNDQYKMVFVINQSLNMSIGKSCSQTAHAALAINELIREKVNLSYMKWLIDGETKIVLKGESTQQLENLKQKADNLGLINTIIQDAGRTEVEPGSKTVFVVFGNIENVDKVTGRLKLLK